jgi:phenylacetate-CoA ligase
VRTIGETLTSEVRELCATAWGAAVSDVYSCEESGYIAIQCGEHHNYHIQSENVLLEIVDEAGHACGPGQTGRVLITTLRNYATPLIRYELGDYAELGEPCPCGRGLPVIRRILGRTRNRLIMPDGESCFPYLGDRADYREITTDIRKFQFVQRSLEEIELKLVLGKPLDQSQERRMQELVRCNLGAHFKVLLTYPEDIAKTGRGKYEEFVSLVAGSVRNR